MLFLETSLSEKEKLESRAYIEWAKSKLKAVGYQEINDLTDFTDGITFLKLLTVCEKEEHIFWDKSPQTIYAKIDNMQILLNFLKTKYKFNLTGISVENLIISPTPKYILALLWVFLRVFHLSTLSNSSGLYKRSSLSLETPPPLSSEDSDLPPVTSDSPTKPPSIRVMEDDDIKSDFVSWLNSVLVSEGASDVSSITELFSDYSTFYSFVGHFSPSIQTRLPLADLKNLEKKDFYEKAFSYISSELNIPTLIDASLIGKVTDYKPFIVYLSLFRALEVQKKQEAGESAKKELFEGSKEKMDTETSERSEGSSPSMFDLYEDSLNKREKEREAKMDKKIESSIEGIFQDLMVSSSEREKEKTEAKSEPNAETQKLVEKKVIVEDIHPDSSPSLEKKPTLSIFKSAEDKKEAVQALKTLRMVLLEFMTSEIIYVSQLDELRKKFISSLPSTATSKLMFLNRDNFKNLESIIGLNNKFLEDLIPFSPYDPSKQAPTLSSLINSNNPAAFFSINNYDISLEKELGFVYYLCSSFPYFKSYSFYASEHFDISKELEKLHKTPSIDPALSAQLENIKKTLRSGSIESYLILPIQRVGRYVLLLREALKQIEKLLKSTVSKEEISAKVRSMRPEGSSEAESEKLTFIKNLHELDKELKRGHTGFSATANAIDKYIAEKEKKDEILAIDAMITDKEKFTKPGRTLIKTGVLYKISSTNDISYLFFLFNDLLAYGKKIRGKLIINNRIPINLSFHAKVLGFQLNQPENRIAIFSTKKSFVVYTESSREFADWMNKLNEVQEKVKSGSKGVEGRSFKPIKVAFSKRKLPGHVSCEVCKREAFDEGEYLDTCKSCSKSACKNCFNEVKGQKICLLCLNNVQIISDINARQVYGSPEYPGNSGSYSIAREKERNENQRVINASLELEKRNREAAEARERANQREREYQAAREAAKNEKMRANRNLNVNEFQTNPADWRKNNSSVYYQTTPGCTGKGYDAKGRSCNVDSGNNLPLYGQMPPSQNYNPGYQPYPQYPQQGFPNYQNSSYQANPAAQNNLPLYYNSPPQQGGYNAGYPSYSGHNPQVPLMGHTQNQNVAGGYFVCPYCKTVFKKMDNSASLVVCAICKNVLTTG